MAHDHEGHGHAHGVSAHSDARWLTIALLLNVGFMVAEIVVGILANSLAVLSDAAHMLTDAGAIGLALFALRLAARPPKGRFTFGLKRAEILSAQLNGVTLLVLAGVIAVSAVQRLISPPEVAGGLVIVIGVAGAFVNGAAAWALSRANRASLNIEGAFLHNLADLYSSAAAAAAGAVIVIFGFERADPLAALSVAALMIYGGWGLVRDSGSVLLEAAPKGLDPQQIGAALAAQPGIAEVHDLHVWEVTSGFPSLSAHVRVHAGDDCHARRRQLQAFLLERFGIDHTTLQVDHESPPSLLSIQPVATEPAARPTSDGY